MRIMAAARTHPGATILIVIGQMHKEDVEGILGADPPNAADLQIASTVRLLMTVGDARALIDGRPCAVLARELFPVQDGEIPAGVLV